jgi:hypothetical protein
VQQETAAAQQREPSYTIRSFCKAEGISRFTYFRLRAEGLAPREMRLGAAVRISHKARLDWQSARENPTGAEAKAVEARRAAMRERSTAAATKAVRSPRHRSKRKARR